MCRPRSPPCPKCRMNPAPPRRSKRHLRKKSRFNFLYIPVCRLRRWIYTKASKTGTVCLTVPRFAAISIAFIPDRRCFFRDYGNLFPLRGRKAFCQRSATGTCRFVMKILLRGFGLGRKAAGFYHISVGIRPASCRFQAACRMLFPPKGGKDSCNSRKSNARRHGSAAYVNTPQPASCRFVLLFVS